MITNEVGSKTIKSFTCLRCSTLDKKNQLRFQDAQATENAQTVHLAFLSMSTKKALQPYTKLAFIPLTELPVKSISMQILQLASNVVERVGASLMVTRSHCYALGKGKLRQFFLLGCKHCASCTNNSKASLNKSYSPQKHTAT